MSIDQAFTCFPTLMTPRLQLRQIRPDDGEALSASCSDEQAMEFYDHETHHTPDDTRSLIARIQAGYSRQESIHRGITRTGEKRVIGSCSFQHCSAAFHCTEIGYELNRAFWRQGIIFEAAFGYPDLWVSRTGMAPGRSYHC